MSFLSVEFLVFDTSYMTAAVLSLCYATIVAKRSLEEVFATTTI